MRRQTERLLFLVSLLALSGCGQRGEKPGAADPASPTTAVSMDVIAPRLPAKTIAYVRLEGAGNLERRLSEALPTLLADAGPVRDKLDAWYADGLRALGRDNPFTLKETTVKRLTVETLSVHLALIPPTADDPNRREPYPLIVLRLANPEVLAAVLEDLHTSHHPFEAGGPRGYRLQGMGPLESALALDEQTLAVGAESLLLRMKSGPGAESLASTQPFQKAHGDLGGRGDLFAFLSLVELKAELVREIDEGKQSADAKERRRKEITNLPFREVGMMAAAMTVDGTLSVTAYAQDGQGFPEFLVRTPTAKRLPGRIPAEAAFTHVCGYDGGKQTRRGFVAWLQEETRRGGLDALGIERSVVGALTQNLDRLESDVVIQVRSMAEDLWLAAIPVKSELAMTVAPDARGRWGLLMAFDIEDRAQAEKLAQELFVAGKGQGLPWKEVGHDGVPIHFLDLEEIFKAKEKVDLPKDMLSNVQMQVGYAMSDELFLVGSVELIKFALRPTGRTLTDVMSVQGVDEKNVLLYNIQPGRLLHSLARIEPLSGTLQPFARRLPPEASYTMTLTIEKERAALRSNVPATALAAWGVMEWVGSGPARSDER